MGIYSIVLGGGGYSDVDEGNMVKYCGTSGAGGEASAGTKMLKKAHEGGAYFGLLFPGPMVLWEPLPFAPLHGLEKAEEARTSPATGD